MHSLLEGRVSGKSMRKARRASRLVTGVANSHADRWGPASAARRGWFRSAPRTRPSPPPLRRAPPSRRHSDAGLVWHADRRVELLAVTGGAFSNRFVCPHSAVNRPYPPNPPTRRSARRGAPLSAPPPAY